MSDRPDATAGTPLDTPPEGVAALLRSEEVWVPAPSVEDAVLAAITGGAQTAAARPPGGAPGRPWSAALVGAAAVIALLAVLVGSGVLQLRGPGPGLPEGVGVVLQPTAEGPSGAQGRAALQDRPDGMRIELEVSGLPPAPPDGYYEATLRAPGGGPVSAGSFHLRGGGDRVVLWAGIDLQPDLMLTISGEPAGTVLLTGRVEGP